MIRFPTDAIDVASTSYVDQETALAQARANNYTNVQLAPIKADAIDIKDRLTTIENSTSLNVSNKYIFASVGERDAYFQQHPSELADGVLVVAEGVTYEYDLSTASWKDVMQVLKGEKGDQGVPGVGADVFVPDYDTGSILESVLITEVPPYSTPSSIQTVISEDGYITIECIGGAVTSKTDKSVGYLGLVTLIINGRVTSKWKFPQRPDGIINFTWISSIYPVLVGDIVQMDCSYDWETGASIPVSGNTLAQRINFSPVRGVSTPTSDAIDTLNNAVSSISASLSAAQGQINDISVDFSLHRATDISRWDNAYLTERQTMVQNIFAMGGKEEVDNKHLVNFPSFNVTDPNGGILDISTINQGSDFVQVTINGLLAYDTNGIIAGITLQKSFAVNYGDVVVGTATGEAQIVGSITPAVIDLNNPITKLRNNYSDSIFSLQQQVSVINAARANKKLGTVTVDIESDSQGTGYIVPENQGLGGQIVYEGIDALIISTGQVSINGTVVYDYGGLLGLAIGTKKESRDVADGDIITSSGLNSITYTAYVEGQ